MRAASAIGRLAFEIGVPLTGMLPVVTKHKSIKMFVHEKTKRHGAPRCEIGSKFSAITLEPRAKGLGGTSTGDLMMDLDTV
jgi:hypothetical protein